MKVPIFYSTTNALNQYVVRAHRENMWRNWLREAIRNPDRLKGES